MTAIDQPELDTRDMSAKNMSWNVVVLNDPVTLMSYVVMVLKKIFSFDEPTATRLMMQVHNNGRAIVAETSREKAKNYVRQLHEHGLQAVMIKSQS